MTDFVSAFGGLFDGKSNMHSYFEAGGQVRMGGLLWEVPDAYIRNSPIFSVNKVSTPLLLMQVKEDPVSSFSQAVEFFTALRRLGKKVWLLEYTDTPTHGVVGESATDFGIRLFQFFNHYLKDAPAPVWMTRGAPAFNKGIEKGFEYDAEIKTPKKGLSRSEE